MQIILFLISNTIAQDYFHYLFTILLKLSYENRLSYKSSFSNRR